MQWGYSEVQLLKLSWNSYSLDTQGFIWELVDDLLWSHVTRFTRSTEIISKEKLNSQNKSMSNFPYLQKYSKKHSIISLTKMKRIVKDLFNKLDRSKSTRFTTSYFTPCYICIHSLIYISIFMINHIHYLCTYVLIELSNYDWSSVLQAFASPLH